MCWVTAALSVEYHGGLWSKCVWSLQLFLWNIMQDYGQNLWCHYSSFCGILCMDYGQNVWGQYSSFCRISCRIVAKICGVTTALSVKYHVWIMAKMCWVTAALSVEYHAGLWPNCVGSLQLFVWNILQDYGQNVWGHCSSFCRTNFSMCLPPLLT